MLLASSVVHAGVECTVDFDVQFLHMHDCRIVLQLFQTKLREQ